MAGKQTAGHPQLSEMHRWTTRRCSMCDSSAEPVGLHTYLRNPLSAIGSAESLNVDESYQILCANQTGLLELSDSVRSSIREDKSLGPRGEELIGFLEWLLRRGAEGSVPISFAIVESTRLDKLLSEITSLGADRNTASDIHTDIMPLAGNLQRQWGGRFREAYFTINEDRYASLPKTGQLKDVVFDPRTTENQGLWKAKSCEELSELEGNLQFESGHWWLNLACAYRDGIVGSVLETPTKGKYGVAALPLLTGKEEVEYPSGVVRYIQEDRISNVHVSLMSRVGSQIRILRGHRLESPLAPKAGIRYDGLYVIRQYGQRLNINTELHKVILILERVKGQLPINEVIKIPRPSQLDDWQLFERYEGEMIKQKRGNRGFLDWKLAKAQEKINREQYRQTVLLHAQIELERVGLTEMPEDLKRLIRRC